MFAAMLEGWRASSWPATWRSRPSSKRLAAVRAFARHADAFPWAWRPQMVDEWLGDLRAVRGLRRSTIRNYAAVGGGVLRLRDRPGLRVGGRVRAAVRHRTRCRSCHEWNTAVHVQDAEGDPAQARVHPRRAAGVLRPRRRPGRPGPRPRAARAGCRLFRDATLFKVAYAFGLRRTEAADARPGRLRRQPARPRVRRLRPLPGPVRQGQQGIAAEAAQRADRVAVDCPRSSSSGSTRSGR